LEEWVQDHNLSPGICAGVAHSRALLNKCYSQMDKSIMYCMEMILHLRYKMGYLSHANWDKEWKTVLKEIITDIWNEYYKPTISVHDLVTLEEEAEDMDFDDIDDYGTSPATSTPPSGDALQDYLNEPPVSMCKDLLGNWNSMLDKPDPKSKKIKITGTVSTHVKRIFSHGGLMVSKRRHGLSDESIRACTVLNPGESVRDCYQMMS
ncbi:hypothetical protein ARMGADRAFT_933555, partial [Armillaria gallica]